MRIRTLASWAGFLLAAGALAGCSSDEGAGGAKKGGETAEDAGPASDELLGGFAVKLVEATPTKGATTTVGGKLHDGETPETLLWSVSQEEGGCRLLVPRVPFCDPACAGTSACVEDGVCAAYPKAASAGKVTVSGLGSGSFVMDPISGSYQPPVGLLLPNPPCPEGAPIGLEAEGDRLPAFALEATGIAPLVLSGSAAIVDGEPIPLRWAPPGAMGPARIQVKLDISHHGGTKGKIECDAADEGSLDIPASLVSSLVALGVAGFPTIVVSRTATSVTKLHQGRVTLTVASAVEREIEVPGVTSCTETSQCPEGELCGTDLRCQ